jgi:hypothetical protein
MKNTRSRGRPSNASIRKRSAAIALAVEKENVISDTTKRRNKGNVVCGVAQSTVPCVELLNGFAAVATAKAAVNKEVAYRNYDYLGNGDPASSSTSSSSDNDDDDDNILTNVGKSDKDNMVEGMIAEKPYEQSNNMCRVSRNLSDQVENDDDIGEYPKVIDVRQSDVMEMSNENNAIEQKALVTNYTRHCESIGIMDSDEHFRDEIKRITRRSGWKHFKVLTDNDYHHSSNFAECKLDHFGYSLLTDNEREVKWGMVKKDVFVAMQIARSGATQSLKRVFLCKLCFVI